MERRVIVFEFAKRQRVCLAGTTTPVFWVCQRRWTDREILGPVIEYGLEGCGGETAPVQWVVEADLAPAEEQA